MDLICFFKQLQVLHATSHEGSFGTKGIFSIEGTGPHFYVIITMSYLKKELIRSLLLSYWKKIAHNCFFWKRLLTNSKFLGVSNTHFVYLINSFLSHLISFFAFSIRSKSFSRNERERSCAAREYQNVHSVHSSQLSE